MHESRRVPAAASVVGRVRHAAPRWSHGVPALIAGLGLVLAGSTATAATREPRRHDAPGAGNPVLPGYFADPSIVRHDGTWYIYATKDPWGGDDLGVWESTNFVDWTFRTINWPTKQAATSPTSGKSKVWAPSVVRGRDGRYWMYVSIGNEIWVGTADRPLGPWRDANGGKPLIPRYYRPGLHMIDAEAFIDDDGTPYLYWGSGLNWINGHCFVVKLKPDMVTFDGEPRDVTPANYFEAPFMMKVGGRYLLTYSNGNTTTDTYEVRYAVGHSPMGPFVEAPGNPILSTDRTRDIISPGHHAIFREGRRSYILYHRQALPFDPAAPITRQVAVDRLEVRRDGSLDRIRPTHGGAIPGGARRAGGLRYVATASASADTIHGATSAADDNYATMWRAPTGGSAWLNADLGRVRSVREVTIRPEYPDRLYRIGLEVSVDGRTWTAIGGTAMRMGSPIRLPAAIGARHVRMTVDGGTGIVELALR